MGDQAEKLRNLRIDRDRAIKPLSRKTRIITITSGKGGVGKSNVTVNLALALSQKKKRVVILDADFGMANVDIICGIAPFFNLYDVIKGKKSLEEIIVKGPMGTKIIPGGTGFSEVTELSNTQRQHLLNQLLELEKSADIILIDTGAGIAKTVLGFIAAAHEVVILTTPEPTSVTDAYCIAKIIGTYKLHKNIKLIVNQVNGAPEGREVARRFTTVSQKFLHLDVDYLGYIHSDAAVSRSVRQQQPLMMAYPDSRAAACIETIADRLLDPWSAPSEINGMNGFFSKIIKIFS
jgi:flagellar biosynthesis protein FlhG